MGGASRLAWYATRRVAGVGGAASLLSRNQDDDFPAWVGRDLISRDPGTQLSLLASDGATATTVATQQLGRLREAGRVPTLAMACSSATRPSRPPAHPTGTSGPAA